MKFVTGGSMMRVIFLSTLLLHLCSEIVGIQFFLESHTKKCFREDIPLGMNTVFTYTVAQGSGAMAVNVYVTNGLEKQISYRPEADHGVITFQSSPASSNDRNRGGNSNNNWAIRNEDNENEMDRLMKEYPETVGDKRLPFFFCFEHPRSLHLPHLSLHGSSPKRRIIFTVNFGIHARGQKYYDELAKEKHLSSTEELFRVVDDRVNDIVRLIDEMRQRDARMQYASETTSRSVVMYSALACLAISVGAVYTSFWTLNYLGRDKRRVR